VLRALEDGVGEDELERLSDRSKVRERELDLPEDEGQGVADAL